MPRRASSSLPLTSIILGVLILVVAVLGGYFVFSKFSDPYRTLTPLDVSAYLENSNSLRGNTYKLQGVITNQLAWSATGRLYSVEPESDAGGASLPLLLPAEFNHITIQKGQRFIFKIEVIDKGILQAKALQKV